MPIGMRSAISSSSTPMPIRPMASLRDIRRALLGFLRSIRTLWIEQHDGVHRRAERDDELERIMRPAHHVADPVHRGRALRRRSARRSRRTGRALMKRQDDRHEAQPRVFERPLQDVDGDVPAEPAAIGDAEEHDRRHREFGDLDRAAERPVEDVAQDDVERRCRPSAPRGPSRQRARAGAETAEELHAELLGVSASSKSTPRAGQT